MTNPTLDPAIHADINRSVSELAQTLHERAWTITTAESCTGGLIAAALTDISGSSAWFKQGIVSYSNEAKSALLQVPEQLLIEHGAVSQAVVESMAQGAAMLAGAEVSVAVTGIAGPTGGSIDKPVGTVWIGWFIAGRALESERYQFRGDRINVRYATLLAALRGTIQRVKNVDL